MVAINKYHGTYSQYASYVLTMALPKLKTHIRGRRYVTPPSAPNSQIHPWTALGPVNVFLPKYWLCQHSIYPKGPSSHIQVINVHLIPLLYMIKTCLFFKLAVFCSQKLKIWCLQQMKTKFYFGIEGPCICIYNAKYHQLWFDLRKYRNNNICITVANIHSVITLLGRHIHKLDNAHIYSTNHVAANKCIKACRHDQGFQQFFRPNVRMWKKCDLSDLEWLEWLLVPEFSSTTEWEGPDWPKLTGRTGSVHY